MAATRRVTNESQSVNNSVLSLSHHRQVQASPLRPLTHHNFLVLLCFTFLHCILRLPCNILLKLLVTQIHLIALSSTVEHIKNGTECVARILHSYGFVGHFRLGRGIVKTGRCVIFAMNQRCDTISFVKDMGGTLRSAGLGRVVRLGLPLGNFFPPSRSADNCAALDDLR